MINITVTPGEIKAIWTIYGAYLQSNCRHCYTDENLSFQVSQTKKFHNIFPSYKKDAFLGISIWYPATRRIQSVFHEYELRKIISK